MVKCLPAMRTGCMCTQTRLACHLVLSYFTHGETEAQGGGVTPPDPNGASHVPSSFDLLHNHLVRKGGFMFIVLRNDPRRLVTCWE